MKTYLNYLWFRLRELCHEIAEYWKEDRWSFLGWVWIVTSIGGCIGSTIFMAFNYRLGFILLVAFFFEMLLPILYWSRGYPIVMAFVSVVRLPISIYYWFEERLESYRKWKETDG